MTTIKFYTYLTNLALSLVMALGLVLFYGFVYDLISSSLELENSLGIPAVTMLLCFVFLYEFVPRKKRLLTAVLCALMYVAFVVGCFQVYPERIGVVFNVESTAGICNIVTTALCLVVGVMFVYRRRHHRSMVYKNTHTQPK